MIHLALVFHIYQPPTQFAHITQKIARHSYGPLFDFIIRYSRVKLALNIPAVLAQQLRDLEFWSLVENVKNLAQKGRLEILGTAKFHPLLPMLPPSEIKHQIRLNSETNENIFGKAFAPLGFFPPEMAYSPAILEVLEKLGYDWLILDQSAFPKSRKISHATLYNIQGSPLKVFFRDNGLSLAVAFKKIKGFDDFVKRIKKEYKEGEFCILAMDGETFGHHHPEYFEFLEKVMKSKEFNFCTLSEITTMVEETQIVEPLTSTWGETLEGKLGQRVFPRWYNPQGPIHQRQWELLYLAIRVVKRSDPAATGYLKARKSLDQGEHSDQFWWASHHPCWHPAMVRRGAELLLGAVLEAPGAFAEEKQRAQNLFEEIVKLSTTLHPEEIVREQG